MINRYSDVGVVFFGPPGSGKGTQAESFEKEGFAILGTGVLLRIKCGEDPIFNNKYGPTMNAGKLLPDEVVTGVFKSYFKKLPSKQNWVMDGFPRTVGQYKDVRGTLLEKNKKHPIVVVIFQLTKKLDQILLKRVLTRGATESGRKDDNRKSFLRRLKEYRRNAPEIISAIKKDHFTIVEIDPMLSKEEIKGLIWEAVYSTKR